MNLERITIRSLESLNPSQIQTLKQCSLKLIFQKSISNVFFFADHPGALLGNIIHKILELANKGNIDNNDFDKKWSEVFESESVKFFRNENNRIFDPLKYWMPYYAAKKILTEKLVKDINKSWSTNSRDQTQKTKIEAEKQLSYEIINGKPDLIIQNDNVFYIKDYKSGSIYKIEKGKIVGLKDEYIEQLKTYGLLVFKAKNTHPQNILLSLISLNGEQSNTYIFNEYDYNNHYSELKLLLDKVNSFITSNKHQDLGNPNRTNCAYCKYRPICNKYKSNVEAGEFIQEGVIVVEEFTIEKDVSETKLKFRFRNCEFEIVSIPIKYIEPLMDSSNKKDKLLFINLSRRIDSIYFSWTKHTKYFNFNLTI